MEEIEYIKENKERYRCGHLYELKLENNDKIIYLDLNHRIELNDGKFIFKKNETWDGKTWDYNKHPLEYVIIDYYPKIKSMNGLISKIDKDFKEQEKKWKVNCNKPNCNMCGLCD